jgi:chemotaxis signal transduction protein
VLPEPCLSGTLIKDETRVNDHPTFGPAPSGSTRPWCFFQSGMAAYAIAVEAVAEVVEVERLVRLPHSPPRVLGLCTLRREVIPVIGLDRSSPASESPGVCSKVTVLILKSGRGRWAFRVNPEGTVVAKEALDDPPAATAHANAPGLAITGTIRRAEMVYAVIDPDATWKNVRKEVEDWYSNHWGRASTPRRGEIYTPAGSGCTPAMEAHR